MFVSIKSQLKRLIGTLRKLYGLLRFRLFGLNFRNTQNLKRLHNLYEGRRCFIICNGPSLKVADLDCIHANGDFSFASNKIDRIFPLTEWRPTFYAVFDETAQFTLLKTMNSIPAQIKFFRKNSYSVTRKVKGHVVWLNANGNRTLLDNPKFAENCTNVIYTIGTVTYAMLQLAVHMGFKELYIIGCDNRYSFERRQDGTIISYGTHSYFTGSDAKDDKATASTWEMNIAYEFTRKYAEAHGIKIYNASRGGHLETFERVNFDDLFTPNK